MIRRRSCSLTEPANGEMLSDQTVHEFCVNILTEDQEALSRAFAGRPPDRFLGVGWRPGRSGSPILADVLAWIECTIDAEHDAGDHVIVVGRVHELDVGHGGGPLVFYRGGYGRFEP